ncbi:MAG: type I toxin-antitoxin system Fst family toxin [Streptococcus mitis]|nr:type I toxin-antitoxin system Fst family toxin [Streptococcus mitis]
MMDTILKTIIGPIVVGVVLRLYSMKIKEQTRKLAAGCTGVRQGEADVV